MEIKFVNSKSIKIKLTKEQWKQISSPEGIAKTLGQKDVIGFDLYDSDTLFGFAMLRKYSDTGWFLWDYAIDAKFQNKHYGQLALKKLIEYMNRNYGATELSTTYLWGNAHAKYIYEKNGFQETDVVEEDDCHEVNMLYII